MFHREAEAHPARVRQSIFETGRAVRVWACALAFVASSSGCGDQTQADELGQGSSTSGASPDPSSSGGDPSEPELPTVLQGIEIDALEVNQGVGIEVALDGLSLSLDDQPQTLVRGRDAVVRATWVLDDDFSPRPLRATLTLNPPDGASGQFVTVRHVEGPSSLDTLDGTLEWPVPGELLQPGVTYQIELTDPETGSMARFFDEEPAVLGVGNEHHEIELVFVPIDLAIGSCTSPAGIDAEILPVIRDHIEQLFPVAEVTLSLAPRVQWTESLTSWSEIISFVRQQRELDGAEPWVHYYAVVGQYCGSVLNGVRSFVPTRPDTDPPMQEQASLRVGASDVSFLLRVGLALDDFARNLGVMHGRGRIACAATEAVDHPDDAAPSGGLLLTPGYGVLDRSLRRAGYSVDTQSECTPHWVTRYGWDQLFFTIETMSTWRDDG